MKIETKNYHEEKKDKSDLSIRTGKEKKSGGMSKVWWGIAAFFVLVILFFASWVNFSERPVSSNSEPVYFELKRGTSTIGIGKELKAKNLIRSKWAFVIDAKIDRRPLKAGFYKLSPSLSMNQIIEKFERGETDAYSFTIPEGFRTLQIAKLLFEKVQITPAKFIAAATGKEGTLFPDTYLLPKGLEVAKLVQLMQDDFTERTKAKPVSEDQLIIASIVEREAKKDDERAKIAAVYFNRLDKNMLFQADPTVQYAVDTQKYLLSKDVNFDFWQAPKKEDFQINSAFNTYKNRGLPPAPICNPGLKSIAAAQNPEKDFGDYLYFFHDKSQQIHFSKTLDEHQKAIKEFGVSG